MRDNEKTDKIKEKSRLASKLKCTSTLIKTTAAAAAASVCPLLKQLLVPSTQTLQAQLATTFISNGNQKEKIKMYKVFSETSLEWTAWQKQQQLKATFVLIFTSEYSCSKLDWPIRQHCKALHEIQIKIGENDISQTF